VQSYDAPMVLDVTMTPGGRMYQKLEIYSLEELLEGYWRHKWTGGRQSGVLTVSCKETIYGWHWVVNWGGLISPTWEIRSQAYTLETLPDGPELATGWTVVTGTSIDAGPVFVPNGMLAPLPVLP
jgi:hypothetical protein